MIDLYLNLRSSIFIDFTFDIKVAIKVISLAEEKLEVIKNEISMMKLSHHPNVVEHRGTYLKDEKLWV